MTKKQLNKLKADLLQWAIERYACSEAIERVLKAKTFKEVEKIWEEHYYWVEQELYLDGVAPDLLPLDQVEFIEMPDDEFQHRYCGPPRRYNDRLREALVALDGRFEYGYYFQNLSFIS